MKNYDETVNFVMEKINEYEIERKHKRKVLARTVGSLCCFCLTVLMGVGVWQSGLFDGQISPSISGSSNQQEGPDTDEESSNRESTDSSQEAIAIWGDAEETQDAGFTEWNGKLISSYLYDVMRDEKNRNCLIAIDVSFVYDGQYIYNGKTLAEYESEAENERINYYKLTQLLKAGEYLKYGEELYKTGTPDGEIWAQAFYEERIAFYGEELLGKYIVNGEFLKEKLEADISKYSVNTPCRDEYEKARDAYYLFAVNEAAGQLKKQNVAHDIINGKRLIIYTTADRLASLSLDSVSIFYLAIKEDVGMDLAISSDDEVQTVVC